MPPRKSQDKFTFVNISSSVTQTEAIRGTVSRHVQSFRRRKKQQDARRLLQSSKFVKGSLIDYAQSDLDSQTDQHEDRALQVLSRRLLVLPPLRSVILLNADLKHMDAAPDIPSATFDSLVGFERDFVQPALARMEYQVTHTTSRYTQIWSGVTRAYLYDNLTVYSFLSRIAATMHMVTGHEEHRIAARHYRDKAVISLRRYLDEVVEIDIKRLYRAFVILILAESAMGDRDALCIHTNLLRDLVISHGKMISDDPLYGVDEVVTIIYQDVQIAILNGTCTFFDLQRGGWIEQLFHPIWRNQAEEIAERISHADSDISPQLEGELRYLYAEVRANMELIVKMRKDFGILSVQTTWLKYFTRAVFVLGRLVNYLTNPLVEEDVGDESDPMHLTSTKLGASACLCAIFWLREFLGVENVLLSENLRIFTANKIIWVRLRQFVRLIDLNRDVLTRLREESKLDLYLWVLFSGASLERSLTDADLVSRRNRSDSGRDLGRLEQFTVQFKHILRVTGTTWAECCVTMQSFLPLEYLQDLIQPGVEQI